MQKISDSTATANPSGEFTSGSAVGGVPATLITPEWLNALQRELLAILTAAGTKPDPTKSEQVSQALAALYAAKGHGHAWGDITGKPTDVPVAWGSVSGKPGTVAGYGISDALVRGEAGLGASVVNPSAIDTVGYGGGFYTITNEPTSLAKYTGLINIPYSDAGYSAQLGFVQGASTPIIVARSCASRGTWTPTVQLWHSGNLDLDRLVPPSMKGIAQGSSSVDPNSTSDRVILTNHANSPDANNYWYVTTTYWGSNAQGSDAAQIAVQYSGTPRQYIRNRYNGSWSRWVRSDLGGVPANSASLASPGWWKCADTGLIRQWGTTGSIANDSSVTITLPVTFPNAMLGANATGMKGPDGGNGPSMLTTNYSRSSFSVCNDAAVSPACWEAWGF